MSDVDQLPEGAEAWGRAVEAAVVWLADDYEIEPGEVLAQEGFIALLDPTVGLDPDADAEAFAERVEEALADWTSPKTRIVGEHGPELVELSAGGYVAALESFQPEHAPAGSAGGGQFTSGGSGGGSSKTAPSRKRKAAPKKTGHAAAWPAGPLGFDGKSGTGYDQPGGDAQVRELQDVVNKLGFKDAQGKPLARDGRFGPRTTAAVQAMQKALGLPTDGKVSPELLARVKGLAGKKKPAPKRAREAEYIEIQRADRIEGRVYESLGTDEAGGRVFRVRIIKTGDSKNRKRYTESVLRRARPLYEGAKSFDHHRTPAEMATSTLRGLAGGYRNVDYEDRGPESGLFADLHLLPSANHVAESLDASIEAQKRGLPPLVGISHDVLASFKAGPSGPRGHVQEAVAITRVHSADVVADPSAGGQAERVLAGGITAEEEAVQLTADEIQALRALAARELGESTSESYEDDSEHVVEADVESFRKDGWNAKAMVAEKVRAAGLPEAVRESVTAALPQRVTEADVDRQIAGYKDMIARLERADLAPTATAQVVKESREKVVEGLDAAFRGDYSTFRSIKQVFEAFSGARQDRWGEDENRVILRESVDYDSRSRGRAQRTTESMTTASWGEVLGDSITRRMVDMYKEPSLRSWRQIVSDIVPVNDFRTQRRVRTGGYGTLPVVTQGAPYQPLTSPTDEEATYALEKKGGTEDLTLEMIANDDLGALARIPKLLGLAAARTLHNFVWDFILTNPTIYDTVALFHASHANTTAAALSQSNVSTLRQKMRDQTGYGDSTNILSLVPKFLIVPNELEELAWQICTSAVAIPATPAGPSDAPNLHQGTVPIVLDYDADANDWFMVADPNLCPTVELGFYQGREEPELFTQNDNSVGSMFNADTVTYKIRHIYKGAVIEYRGFQRATQ